MSQILILYNLGVMDLIKQLQSMNKDIYLVSGGFKQVCPYKHYADGSLSYKNQSFKL